MNPPPSLSAGQVHVWCVSLQPSESDPLLLAGRSLLSAEEWQRAERFVFRRDRERFVLCRGTLRLLLARYTGTAPERLEFACNAFGKPRLKSTGDKSNRKRRPREEGSESPGSPDQLCFNVSHSGAEALIAVARDGEVGIDIEQQRPLRDLDNLAAVCLSKKEQVAWRALPAPERQPAFFRIWTRKEALIKAWGQGLTIPLQDFQVSVDSQQPRLLNVAATLDVSRDWQLGDLPVADGFAAALAARHFSDIRLLQWPRLSSEDLGDLGLFK